MITLYEMEKALVRHFNMRRHFIVPNVSWGLGIHECDLLLVKKTGYAVEIEIKRSVADIKKDLNKKHKHISNKIKELWFAIPESLMSNTYLIPERAGILTIEDGLDLRYRFVKIIRKPISNKDARMLTDEEIFKLGMLAAMRIWKLKSKLFIKEKL